jgi:subtilisin family serine protease
MGVTERCRSARVDHASDNKCQHPIATNTAIAASIRDVMKENNTVVVISAGNDTEKIAAFGDITNAGLMVVGAMNEREDISSYSNFGPGVSLLAPDFGVWGLSFDGYREEAATSFTTPLVSGAAALTVAYLRSNKIPYTPADIRRLIMGSVHRTKSLTFSSEAGGYLDFGQLARAVQAKVQAKKALRHLKN